jgi:hypothetical protein
MRILLTRLLTTDPDNAGSSWSRCALARPASSQGWQAWSWISPGRRRGCPGLSLELKVAVPHLKPAGWARVVSFVYRFVVWVAMVAAVGQSSKRVPTVFGMNASPKRAPIACWARHPVQWAGHTTLGARAPRSSRTRGMRGIPGNIPLSRIA